ncbi:MAG TPA: DUF695 domain-containing protein [Steroidobacteraceae bacterium]|jgi:hypothetical protein
MKTKIPAPYYTLINTSIGPDPAVVIVNSALRTFDHLDYLQWDLSIVITCESLGANGMPNSEEARILNELEDEISESLKLESNAVFLARVTCRDKREIRYRVHDPEIANRALKTLTSSAKPQRQWKYLMKHDPEWRLAKPELNLLEQDSRYN